MHQNNPKDLILMILFKKFFFANFAFSLSERFNKFTIFCVSNIYMIVAEFCEKLKVVSFDFSMMKNIVAPSLPIKPICCESFNLICLLKSIAISLCVFF